MSLQPLHAPMKAGDANTILQVQQDLHDLQQHLSRMRQVGSANAELEAIVQEAVIKFSNYKNTFFKPM
jgi:hypothetical protein